MNILSIEFRKNWSWGLIFNEMQNISEHNIKRVFMGDKDKIPENGYDVVLGQNVTLLKRFKERLRAICRLGGNYNFDKMDGIEPLLDEMAKCHALIATNKKLYEIAKSVNPNTYLIPNGINLNEWKQPTVFYGRKFTVGFCANISTDHYRLYKGYDFVSKACANLGFELKTALYNNKQIPHEEMQRRFYHVIDVLVHPTLGEGCISEDQELFVDYRLKKAKDVKVGDSVWGGTVKHIYDNGTSDVWYKFDTGRLPAFETTAEHPIKIAKWKWRWSINGKKTTKKECIGYEWKKAEEVKEGDFLVVPKLKKTISNQEIVLRVFQDANIKQHTNTTFELDGDFAFFLGRYVADGSIGDDTQIHVSIGKKKINDVLRLQNILSRVIGKPINFREKESIYEIRFRHAPLAEWLKENIGHNVYEKRAPKCILVSDKNITMNFIEGYLYGDGYKEKNLNTWSIQNTSRELSHHLVLLMSKLDILPAFYIYKKKKLTAIIKGRIVNQHPFTYFVRFPLSANHNKWYFQDTDNFYVKVKDISKVQKQAKRINFETTTSEYNVLYFNTHNCSNTLMEACACGVPIITTREAGFHGELMQDMVDVLFCERTVASIQSKLLLLRTDPALRMFLGGNARKFAEQHHDVKKIALQYEQIFQECYDYNKNIGEY
jgi:hypothetical protein